MFEHNSKPLLSRKEFYKRLIFHFSIGSGIIVISLFMGVLGYHLTEGLNWIDSLLNASMILGGMGPVDPVHTTGGKLFASFYSLFSGIIFLVIVGVMFVPVYHRFLHKFHLNLPDKE